MAENNRPTEEMRQCPTCRMMVSVWATKCHHCGEDVGRPRREEKRLTMEDLGGTKQNTYVPSGNVTGAFESFRVDEDAALASRAARKPVGFWARLLGKKVPLAEPIESAPESQPERDEYSKNLAASILDDSPASSTASPSRSSVTTPVSPLPSVAERVVKAVGVLVLVVVLYFAGSIAWSKLSAYVEARNRPPEINYVSKVPEMLARDEQIIDVFAEAVNAVGIVDSEENNQTLSDVRKMLLKEVDGLVRRNPWKLSNYDAAYRFIQRAAKLDNHPSLIAALEEVTRELNAYKFVLKSVDDTAGKATFRLNNPEEEEEETVQVADRLMNRFIIQRISSRSVDLNDDKIDGRKLTIRLNEGVRSPY